MTQLFIVWQGKKTPRFAEYCRTNLFLNQIQTDILYIQLMTQLFMVLAGKQYHVSRTIAEPTCFYIYYIFIQIYSQLMTQTFMVLAGKNKKRKRAGIANQSEVTLSTAGWGVG